MLIILGACVSLLVQFLKTTLKTNQWVTLAIVLGLSFVSALFYFLLTRFNLWQSFAAVVVIAGAVYAYIIQRFEKAGLINKETVDAPLPEILVQAGLEDQTLG